MNTQTRIDHLSIWKIVVALALGPAVMAAILVIVVLVAPLVLVIGIPYYFFAREIHRALTDNNRSNYENMPLLNHPCGTVSLHA